MKKRIFSRVLALFMALSLLTTTVFAASLDDLQEAIDGTNDVTVADDTAPVEDAKPADQMPEASETDTTDTGTAPADESTETTEPEDTTHVNGALVRTDDNGTNYFGYGWSSVTENENTTWYYAIEAHDENGNRFVVLLDNVDSSGTANGVVIKADSENPDKLIDIDMKGHSITGDGTGAVIKVESDAKLDLSNGTISGGQIGIDVLGTLFLDSVTVTKNGTGVKANSGSKVTLTGDKNNISENTTKDLTGNGKVTVQVNGKTYTVDADTAEVLLAGTDSVIAEGENWLLTKNSSDTYTVIYSGNEIKNMSNVLETAAKTKHIPQEQITKLVISDGPTEVPDLAFHQQFNPQIAKSLKSIVLPDSVTKIGGNAFNGCGALETVNLPKNLETIDKQAFINCSSLKEVQIPDSVTSIAEGAFHGCGKLTKVTLGNQISKISSSTFVYCTSLTTINLPNSLTEIGDSAFMRCSALAIDLSKLQNMTNLRRIGTHAFESCRDLHTDVVLPPSLETIDEFAFNDCEQITSISFPKDCKLTTIGKQAFQGCKNLTGTFKIPDGISSIGYYAFRNCDKLTSVEFPSTISEIDKSAFTMRVNAMSLIKSGILCVGEDATEDAVKATTDAILKALSFCNVFVIRSDEDLTFSRDKVTAHIFHDQVDGSVDKIDGSVNLTSVSGTITTDKETVTLPDVAGITASIDTNGNITLKVPGAITVGGEEYPDGAIVTVDPNGNISARERPSDDPPVISFDFDAITADTSTTIEDEEVPLAGLVTLAELLEALRQYEDVEDVELPEDFQWVDHEYAQAIYWGLTEALVVDTEDDPLDPDEIVTVALLREVLENFVEYKGANLTVTVEGEDDMIVMDLGERLTVFYGELEAALSKQAA